jgi:hypothetical protein
LVLLVALYTAPSWAAMTESQKKQILNVFNLARATTVVPAANMKMLAWDEDIAAEMQAYTDQCANYYTEFRNPPAFFAYRDTAIDPVGVAKWRTLRMAPYFDYETGGCINTTMSKQICRHPENYANVVYWENERVGCGVTTCAPGPRGTFHACAIGAIPRPTEYEPFYSYITEMWKKGPRCSSCPTGWDYCINGLCSKTPGTIVPSSSPNTARPSKSPITRAPTPPTTQRPSKVPTTSKPSKSPNTARPTSSPVPATYKPSKSPATSRPSKTPTTPRPTKSPTTSRPSVSPTHKPSKSPTITPPPTNFTDAGTVPAPPKHKPKKRRGLDSVA